MNKKKSIAIIGSKKFKKSTVENLLKEAKKEFDKVVFAPIDKLVISFNPENQGVFYKNSNISSFDVVYPRVNSGDRLFAEPLLKILSQSNCYCPVSLDGYKFSNNKYYTVQKLAEHGLPVLLSSLSLSGESMPAIEKNFSFPIVLKVISGFAGKGVMLIENKKQLSSILDTIHLYEECVSAQKYVQGKNYDIRCYVIGEKVISVKRISGTNDFRANISRGGRAELIEVPEKTREIARKTASVMEMDICAIDFIELDSLKQEHVIVEVNFQPGPFTKYLGSLVPKEMISFLKQKISGSP